jgi:nucleoside-diphosphate-sugar epimerase
LTRLAGTRLLLTGASGFIGAAVARAALAAGAQVVATTRRAPAVASPLDWRRTDLADGAAVERLFASVRPERVIHLASEVSGARELDLVLPMLHANFVAAVNVMVAATRHGCTRVVLAGSMEEPPLDAPPPAPQSPYAAAKMSAHLYSRMLHGLFGTPALHLRLFMVYGPGQNDLRKLVPYVTTTLHAGGTPQLMSGERLIDWVYVEDVADAVLRATVGDGLDGMSIDVGTGKLVSVRVIVERLVALTGAPVRPVFGALSDRPAEPVRAADPSAAERLLGWIPRTSLDEGLRRTVAAYSGIAS